MSELDKIILGGEELNFIDRTARVLASDAQSTANTANTTAQSAQSTANTANTTAQSAHSTANTANATAQSAQSTANTANTTAQSAHSTANTANATAQSAQSTANTANTTAQSAQNLANEIIEGFNTQFLQIRTEKNYIAPYYCKRNNEIFVEFPNIPFLKNVQANVWTKAFTMPTGFRPMSQCYRSVNVGNTTTMLIEINPSGVIKILPSADYNTSFAIFGGFSFLTAN